MQTQKKWSRSWKCSYEKTWHDCSLVNLICSCVSIKWKVSLKICTRVMLLFISTNLSVPSVLLSWWLSARKCIWSVTVCSTHLRASLLGNSPQTGVTPAKNDNIIILHGTDIFGNFELYLFCMIHLLSTHANMLGVDISFTGFVCLIVC